MCGIAGYLTLDGAPAALGPLQRMTDAVAHRGPDGEGHHVAGPIALGHRRLAILDLTDTGRQPMSAGNGRWTISYNGEVYNFRELRRELETLGHRFDSRTDSEVVLKAWVQWGPGCLTRLNGMFAFAIWDAERQAVYLARDRYGVKPVYHARRGAAFLFGSEIKALLAHGALSAQIDTAALVEYMTFQNFFGERTLFAGVEILPPGTWMMQAADGRPATITEYWDFNFSQPTQMRSADEYEEELDALFRQAVGRQMVSDVPVSAYLSGGVDSGSITAVASGHLPGMNTFTVGFDLSSASGMEMAFDERRGAEAMSNIFKTEHYEMVLKAGDMERALPSMAWHLEEPRVGQSYPNFYAAKLASRFGKVVLSGAGGDELFGGYPWRYYRAVVNDHFDDYVDKYHQYWSRLIPPDTAQSMFRPIAGNTNDVSTRAIFRQVFRRHADMLTTPEDYINHSLYFEAKTFLHGLLVVEDKLSMAHGLESRVPFLDNDLVDFAMRIPVNMKLGNLGEAIRLNENDPAARRRYFDKTHDGKLILRKVMARHVPADVSNAAKQGFSAPDASWFRGESITYVRDLLLGSRARIYDFLDRDTVEALVQEHLSGQTNRRLLIWSLLSLEHWCNVFLAGNVPHRGTAARPNRLS